MQRLQRGSIGHGNGYGLHLLLLVNQLPIAKVGSLVQICSYFKSTRNSVEKHGAVTSAVYLASVNDFLSDNS